MNRQSTSLPEPGPQPQIGDASNIAGITAHCSERKLVRFFIVRLVSTVLVKTFFMNMPRLDSRTGTDTKHTAAKQIRTGFRLSLLNRTSRTRPTILTVQLPREPDRINHSPATDTRIRRANGRFSSKSHLPLSANANSTTIADGIPIKMGLPT